MSSALHECSHGRLKIAQQLVVATQVLKYVDHPKAPIIEQGHAKRVELESVWESALDSLVQQLLLQADVESAYEYAVSQQTKKRRWQVRKTVEEDEISARLAASMDTAAWARGAVQVYLGLALSTSEAAGMYALQMLGLGTTFAWAHPRAMAQNLFGLRGSKVITNMYDSHMSALARIIQEATNPANPLTIAQVKLRIAEEWPRLEGWQALRIARTETAAVWTSTAANAYRANGITHVESLIAQGPLVGVVGLLPCEICIDMAALGAMPIGLAELPPYHPNCRCETVPLLESDAGEPWLPPAEPWAGGDDASLIGTPELPD